MIRMKRYMVALASLLLLLVVGHFYVNRSMSMPNVTADVSQTYSRKTLTRVGHNYPQHAISSSNESTRYDIVTGLVKYLHRQLDANVGPSRNALSQSTVTSLPAKKHPPTMLIPAGHFPAGLDVRPFMVDPVKYALRMARIRLFVELYGPQKTRQLRQKNNGELVIPEMDIPKREIAIVTYWRSGSSFLGDLINHYPATFYHFEPLHSLTFNNAVSTPEEQQAALQLIQNLLKCNYSQLKSYLDWVHQPDHQFLFSHNHRLWVACRVRTKLCFDAKFLTEICKAHPVQLVKLVRLRLGLTQTLLKNNTELKVIYLVRDPRGVLSSRMGLDWCNESHDCIQPSAVCESMRQDLEIAKQLKMKFPGQFLAFRYEDLALDPKNRTEELFKFLDLPLHRHVTSFLRTNTQAGGEEQGGPYSTRRNSKTTAFKWRHKLSFEQVQDVQSACADVIQNLGYSLINSEAEMKDLSWSIIRPSSNLLKPK